VFTGFLGHTDSPTHLRTHPNTEYLHHRFSIRRCLYELELRLWSGLVGEICLTTVSVSIRILELKDIGEHRDQPNES